MSKDNYSQSDLFSDSSSLDENRSVSRRSMLSYVRGYEKFIVFILSCMVLSLVSFSLGVEKGKRLAVKTAQTSLIVNTQIQSGQVAPRELKLPASPVSNTAIKPNNYSTDTVVTKLDAKPQHSGRYTIQVASFKTSSLAQKESKELEKKGFSTIVSSKGKYVILCVGNFAGREEAKTTLSQLKKRYEDCFIRRL